MQNLQNASDVFALAAQFEELAVNLYVNLAQVSNAPDARRVFAQLAREEAVHRGFFSRLGAADGRRTSAVDPDAALAMMRTHILPDRSVVNATALSGNQAKALQMALQMEQNAVVFYRDMAAAAPARAADIATIIHEEHRHAQLISDMLTVRGT